MSGTGLEASATQGQKESKIIFKMPQVNTNQKDVGNNGLQTNAGNNGLNTNPIQKSDPKKIVLLMKDENQLHPQEKYLTYTEVTVAKNGVNKKILIPCSGSGAPFCQSNVNQDGRVVTSSNQTPPTSQAMPAATVIQPKVTNILRAELSASVPSTTTASTTKGIFLVPPNQPIQKDVISNTPQMGVSARDTLQVLKQGNRTTIWPLTPTSHPLVQSQIQREVPSTNCTNFTQYRIEPGGMSRLKVMQVGSGYVSVPNQQNISSVTNMSTNDLSTSSNSGQSMSTNIKTTGQGLQTSQVKTGPPTNIQNLNRPLEILPKGPPKVLPIVKLVSNNKQEQSQIVPKDKVIVTLCPLVLPQGEKITQKHQNGKSFVPIEQLAVVKKPAEGQQTNQEQRGKGSSKKSGDQMVGEKNHGQDKYVLTKRQSKVGPTYMDTWGNIKRPKKDKGDKEKDSKKTEKEKAEKDKDAKKTEKDKSDKDKDSEKTEKERGEYDQDSKKTEKDKSDREKDPKKTGNDSIVTNVNKGNNNKTQESMNQQESTNKSNMPKPVTLIIKKIKGQNCKIKEQIIDMRKSGGLSAPENKKAKPDVRNIGDLEAEASEMKSTDDPSPISLASDQRNIDEGMGNVSRSSSPEELQEELVKKQYVGSVLLNDLARCAVADSRPHAKGLSTNTNERSDLTKTVTSPASEDGHQSARHLVTSIPEMKQMTEKPDTCEEQDREVNAGQKNSKLKDLEEKGQDIRSETSPVHSDGECKEDHTYSKSLEIVKGAVAEKNPLEISPLNRNELPDESSISLGCDRLGKETDKSPVELLSEDIGSDLPSLQISSVYSLAKNLEQPKEISQVTIKQEPIDYDESVDKNTVGEYNDNFQIKHEEGVEDFDYGGRNRDQQMSDDESYYDSQEDVSRFESRYEQEDPDFILENEQAVMASLYSGTSLGGQREKRKAAKPEKFTSISSTNKAKKMKKSSSRRKTTKPICSASSITVLKMPETKRTAFHVKPSGPGNSTETGKILKKEDQTSINGQKTALEYGLEEDSCSELSDGIEDLEDDPDFDFISEVISQRPQYKKKKRKEKSKNIKVFKSYLQDRKDGSPMKVLMTYKPNHLIKPSDKLGNANLMSLEKLALMDFPNMKVKSHHLCPSYVKMEFLKFPRKFTSLDVTKGRGKKLYRKAMLVSFPDGTEGFRKSKKKQSNEALKEYIEKKGKWKRGEGEEKSPKKKKQKIDVKTDSKDLANCSEDKVRNKNGDNESRLKEVKPKPNILNKNVLIKPKLSGTGTESKILVPVNSPVNPLVKTEKEPQRYFLIKTSNGNFLTPIVPKAGPPLPPKGTGSGSTQPALVMNSNIRPVILPQINTGISPITKPIIANIGTNASATAQRLVIKPNLSSKPVPTSMVQTLLGNQKLLFPIPNMPTTTKSTIASILRQNQTQPVQKSLIDFNFVKRKTNKGDTVSEKDSSKKDPEPLSQNLVVPKIEPSSPTKESSGGSGHSGSYTSSDKKNENVIQRPPNSLTPKIEPVSSNKDFEIGSPELGTNFTFANKNDQKTSKIQMLKERLRQAEAKLDEWKKEREKSKIDL